MSNMKYYTKITPIPLYYKLLKKGMPISRMTYAEVFDWLLGKGICVNIRPEGYVYTGDDMWQYICYGKHTYGPVGATKGWIETANDAILHAIELI